MRSSASKYFLLTSVVALAACSSDGGGGANEAINSDDGGSSSGGTGAGDNTAGMSGATAAAGGGASGASEGGTSNGGGGATSVGGVGGSTGGDTTGGAGGETGGTGGETGGTGGGVLGSDLTAVVPSAACTDANAAAPAGNGPFVIMTTGTKATNCADTNNGGDCGPTPWNYPRQYFVYLPQGYDPAKAYPLVFEGPGCGGHGDNIYGYSNNVDQTIIRVGLTPSDGGPDGGGGQPPGATQFHATNPGQGCFDDKEGDDSVDWVLYENLYDLLATQICFDRNRVFAGGDSSGAWFSNELGCKYAGDPTRPVRGIMPNTGGLPNQPEFEPTCTDKPMAGFWSHEIGDTVNGFAGNKFAIARAMTVDGCTMGTGYDDATLVNFPIGGGKPDDTCKQIQSCNPLTPLVVCALNGTQHQSHSDVVEPGVATFLKLFSAAPLLP